MESSGSSGMTFQPPSNANKDDSNCGIGFTFVDFLPECRDGAGLLSSAVYDTFRSLVDRANVWLQANRGWEVTTCESVEFKSKKDESADTEKMTFREHGERSTRYFRGLSESVDTQKTEFTEHGYRGTFYLRILRVAYTRPRTADVSDVKPSNTEVTQLTCRTFKPVPLREGSLVDHYETLQETKRRVRAWVKATGARVISAETSAMRIYTGGECEHGPEASFTYNVAGTSEYWIFVIRLYLNGAYREPPPEMLPPMPEFQDTDCCVIL